MSTEVVAAAAPDEVLSDVLAVVGVGVVRMKELLEACEVMAARCRVSVLVRVTVLVEVLVDIVSATAASGTRRAVRMVGRCMVAGRWDEAGGEEGKVGRPAPQVRGKVVRAGSKQSWSR